MAVTTSFVAVKVADLPEAMFEDNLTITELTDGGFMLAGENTVFLLGRVDLADFNPDGTADGSTTSGPLGFDPAIDLLTGGNVVLAYESGDDIIYQIRTSAGATSAGPSRWMMPSPPTIPTSPISGRCFPSLAPRAALPSPMNRNLGQATSTSW